MSTFVIFTDDVREWMIDHGLNLTILWDASDARRFALGLGLTLVLAVLSVLLSLLVGVVGACLKGCSVRVLRDGVTAYVELFRNTPLLAQLFFFFFGVGSLLPMVSDGAGGEVRMIGNFEWAVFVLGLSAGAVQIEALRAGVDSVPRATVEAAQALGLSHWQILRKVVGPIALRNSLPALGNGVAMAVKSTSVAFAIAVPELTYAVNRIWSDNFNVPIMIQILLATYLLMIGAVSWSVRKIEQRLYLPGHHYA